MRPRPLPCAPSVTALTRRATSPVSLRFTVEEKVVAALLLHRTAKRAGEVAAREAG